MSPPNLSGAEPGSIRAEETSTPNVTAEIETVKPDPADSAAESLPPKQNLTPGQARRLEAIRRDAPSAEGAFLRCYERKASPRQAIKGQCLDCQGLDRQGVATCGDRCCPLWHFRPFRQGNHRVPPEKREAGPGGTCAKQPT